MNFLEITGLTTIGLIVLKIVYKVVHKAYRKKYPKKYTWETCPVDHDTMARYGYTGKCEKCGN